MKKMLLGFAVLFFIGLVAGLPNPSTSFCEEMNYTFNETHCIFSANASCELWSFYNGSCGVEYVKNLSCANAGEQRGISFACCDGLSELDSFNIVEGECQNLVGAYAMCSDCGNGICDDWENRCNCEEDCGVGILCEDLCGDGTCQEVVCQGKDCPCAETSDSCPNDCQDQKGILSSYNWIVLVLTAVVLIVIGLKVLKWFFWGLAILAIILAIWFFVF